MEGYWGPPTATMDWCERNYLVTPYAAEFFNSLTSLFIAVAGLLPFIVHFRRLDLMEWRTGGPMPLKPMCCWLDPCACLGDSANVVSTPFNTSMAADSLPGLSWPS